eukprot:CAMPEP_0172454966 /NCGR_PEP_ID=MMETSP1065-20121228/11800_1 /TAXON_ID=265537 /ORGANISM="Amphiprora paludosa, Strain CCMP125" /LENGTH=684 /DNA_ID=CAMNT_0013207389 /DNA_START=125 /DNA_END=2179 /DNA_ORIENTATION=-
MVLKRGPSSKSIGSPGSTREKSSSSRNVAQGTADPSSRGADPSSREKTKTSSPSKGLFRRRRASMGNHVDEVQRGVPSTKSADELDFGAATSRGGGARGEPSGRGVRRYHSNALDGMRLDSNAGAEYMEVIVNGKKKMVRVKKKSSSDADGGHGAGTTVHRKLVKVKAKQVVKKPKESDGPKDIEVPMKLNIPANHQLRTKQKSPRHSGDDAASGVWSKAARSLFSFGGTRSKSGSSVGADDEDAMEDFVFEPEDGEKDKAGQSLDNNKKSNHSRGSRSKGGTNWKPPTQLNGEPGVDSRSRGQEEGKNTRPVTSHTTPSPNKSPLKSEFFEKYVEEEYDPNAPPVLEINTAANNTKTKTKSVFQSESMVRRQFIQDQWLSGGSNYIVWEKAAANKSNNASVSTPATEYTSDEEEDFADDVSDITCEDLAPPILLEQDDKKELDLWESLCDSRIQRLGPRNALTADAFVNRGIAQLHANRLEEAADSLLSAVCFLEEVYDSEHIHMGLVFFLLGKVYMQQEQYPMAESALAKALGIRQMHLGKVHPDTVECWEQLGLSYIQRASQIVSSDRETSQFLQKQAMEILTQVLKLKRAIFGSIHPSVAKTAHAVAKLCAMRNENERAQRLYKQVMAVLSKVEKAESDKINPDFPDPAETAAKQMRRQQLNEIEEEMRRFGLKEEILEI